MFANHSSVLDAVLGPVEEEVFSDIDVYIVGIDEQVVTNKTVTVRQAASVRGWVGIIDSDLAEYADLRLEFRAPGGLSVPFVAGPTVGGQTLIRGCGMVLPCSNESLGLAAAPSHSLPPA